jgi:hypothetical protein
MSDGHYCLFIDLGPVKGGRGTRHHEVVIDFSQRGIVELFRRANSWKEAADRLRTDYR